MRAISGAFALGVFTLQQQSALPGAAAWVAGAALFAVLAAGAMRVRAGQTSSAIRCTAAHTALLVAAGLAGFGYAAGRAQARLNVELPTRWEGRDIVVTGTVRGIPSRQPDGVRFLFDVTANSTELARFPGTLRLAWVARGAAHAPPALAPGDRWRLTVRLKRPHGNANAGVRDAEAGWLARDIRALGYVTAPQEARRLPAVAGGPGGAIDRRRAALGGRIGEVLDGAPHRGIVAALAIGAQHDISVSDWQVLRHTGTSHLVAISGLHVGIVGSLCGWLVASVWRRSGWLGRNWPLVVSAQKVAALGGLLGAAGYAALAGFNVPAQRAWWMLAVASVAYLGGRGIAPSSVLAWALLCVLLVDPWAAVAPGFWLSFGAVAAILFVVSGRFGGGWRDTDSLRDEADAPLSRWAGFRRVAGRAARGVSRRVREAARVQYAVTIALAPLTVVWFSQIPLLGPVANAFAIPWVSVLVVPPVLAGIVLPAPLDALAYRFAHALVSGMMQLCAWLAESPRALLWLPEPGGFALAAAVAGALWALLPRGWPLRWAAPLAWLPLLVPASTAPLPGAFRLTALDVGQGGAVLVETARHTLLFDAGPGPESTHAGERIVVPFLRARGIPVLDALVVSHADADHAGGAPAVLAGLPVRQLVGGLPPSHRLWRTARAAGAEPTPCAAGQRWRWDGIDFAMLWPEGGPRPGASNPQSCVLRVSAGGHAALLTGDIDARGERTLVARNRETLAAQVLVVPHHGSRTSSTELFLDSVEPRFAVFQVGYRNRFRHPHPTVWARYLGRGIALPRTDRDGAVRIDVNGVATTDRATARPAFVLERYRDAHRRYWMDGGAAGGPTTGDSGA
ncbi:DNA internalization-related competence protein ComEC/Rec2 [Burkholderia alba]|uniref:DNA internalization-related competence protein ComEC/Rec2 n=1 Tax=Burkholderia alba TaxID=2683677 RepID=UPI002B061DF8|nr:DNA internalization-related competence protein ComEC/Rec2 [Burkholderia alba]